MVAPGDHAGHSGRTPVGSVVVGVARAGDNRAPMLIRFVTAVSIELTPEVTGVTILMLTTAGRLFLLMTSENAQVLPAVT